MDRQPRPAFELVAPRIEFDGAQSAGADNVSLTAMWPKWIGPGSLASGLTAVSVVLLMAVAATMWRQRERVAEPDYTEFAFLLLIIPLVSPQGWDYV